LKKSMAHDSSPTNKSQRVAFCISSFRFGGGERVMIDLANWAAERGIPVDLVVLSRVGQFEGQVDPRVRVVSFNSARLLPGVLSLTRYLIRERPRVLIALDEACHIAALMAKTITRVSTRIILRVGTMMTLLYATRPAFKDQVRNQLLHLFYPKADTIIAVSAGVKDDMVRNFRVAPEKVTIIHNPKKIEEIERAAQEPVEHPWLTPGHEIPVVVGVGRFRELKGFGETIEAFAQVSKKIPCRLLLVGDGRDKVRLESLVEKFNLKDSVSFTGYVENPHAYVARSDIFTLASWWEGMPNSLVEAIICGVPVVATDCLGPREVLAPSTDPLLQIKEGVEWTPCGALVPIKGVAELAQALEKLLSDGELRKRCSEAARKRGRDFNAPEILAKYFAILGVS
jgi:glycosyltransferase involved in cell wall biosynthesis